MSDKCIRRVLSWTGVVAAVAAWLATGSGCAATGKSGSRIMPARDIIQVDRILIIAHRGASAYAPENTLAAFKLAIRQKADLIEDDYHVSKDGKLIVIHDDTLDRTTDAVAKWGGEKIKVETKTLDELRQLDAGSWKNHKYVGEKLPTFNEATLTMLEGSVPLLERKGGTAAQTLADLQAIDAVEKVVVQAFEWEFLSELHQLEPKIVLGALGGKELDETKIDQIKQTGAAVVGWEHKDLKPRDVKRLHAEGFRVWAWTVNDTEDIKRVVEMGVDGIITDRPAATRRIVEGLAQ